MMDTRSHIYHKACITVELLSCADLSATAVRFVVHLCIPKSIENYCAHRFADPTGGAAPEALSRTAVRGGKSKTQ